MPQPLRVLFCIGVLQELFSTDDAEHEAACSTITKAFDDLAGRFGVTVLGTMDDNLVARIGSASGWPWTAYVLADAPDLDAVAAVCDIVRSTEIGAGRLWRYLKIEARVGRPLFFANA